MANKDAFAFTVEAIEALSATCRRVGDEHRGPDAMPSGLVSQLLGRGAMARIAIHEDRDTIDFVEGGVVAIET